MLSTLQELLSLVRSQQTEISELRQQLQQLTQYQADEQRKTASIMHDVQLVKEMVTTISRSEQTEFSSEECIQFIVPCFIGPLKSLTLSLYI